MGRARPDAATRKEPVITDPTAPAATRSAATTVLLAVGSPVLRRHLSDGMAPRGPFAFLEADSPDRTEQIVSGVRAGELAVVDMAFAGRRAGDTPLHLVDVLRRKGWDHIVALGDVARGDTAQLERVGATLQAGARAYLFTSGSRTGDEPHPVGRRVRVRDTDGHERELSHREVEVLRLAAEGLSNGEIGHVLRLSSLTVKSHLARITHRLHARDRAHLVLLALRAGAIS